MLDEDTLHINVGELLKQRAPQYARFIPSFAIRYLERLIHQDEINQVLQSAAGCTGVEFAQHALKHLQVRVQPHYLDKIDPNHRYIFAANHPLGGLDGLALIALLGERFQGRLHFVVNDLLMAISPLQEVFLPVNKYGRQSRAQAELMAQAMAGDGAIATFPAGLCSRSNSKGYAIQDLPWRKHFVTQAIRYQRDVVPVYIDAWNSRRFYRWAHRRERWGLKFNYEMLLLPDEMFRKRNSTIEIYFAPTIPWQKLTEGTPEMWAEKICDYCYWQSPHIIID